MNPEPKTEAAQAASDEVKLGQRKVNLIWERTQAAVAFLVSVTTLYVAGNGNDGAFLFLSNVFFLVVGTYFQRTNHTEGGGLPHR